MENSSNIKVSLIVPCYNVEKYLPKCLDSILAQTLDGIEIICVNDESPDNCLKILKDYQTKYGKDKIIIINKKNGGLGRARISGIKKARGEFIGFIDSDDYVAPRFAEKLYNAAIENHADIAVCGFDRINLETGKLYSREMHNPKQKNIIPQEDLGPLLEVNCAAWNKLYRTSLIKAMPKETNVPPIFEDLTFINLLYLNVKKITFVADSLYRYIVRSDSIINTIKEVDIAPTYDAMKEVRKYYTATKNQKYIEYIDTCAFLHFGISLMSRIFNSKTIDYNRAFKKNNAFLNQYFPTWRKSRYVTFRYVIKHKRTNLKLSIMKKIYVLHLLKIFFSVYNFMINHLGIDIKW